MDNKRRRDAIDDEPALASAKRVCLDNGVSAALHPLPGASPSTSTSTSAMQAVAHEALAMTTGAGFTAINKTPRTLPATPHPPSPLPPPPPLPPIPATDHRPSRNHQLASLSSRNGTSTNIGLDTFSDITRRFKTAAANGWTRRSPTYVTIDALLLSWADDETELAPTIASIKAAFSNHLHYFIEEHVLHSTEASHDAVRAKVEWFFHRDKSPDRLAILYYAGQCVSSSTADGQPLLIPRNRKTDSAFPFSQVQAAYESTGCDVVLLLDHADAVPQVTLGSTERHNVIELIVAPAPDPELGLMSFAKALAEELANASEYTSIEALHVAISRRMSGSKPRGRGRPPKEPPARPPVDQRYLPKHQILSSHRNASVVLAPLPKEPQVILCLRFSSGSTDVNEWAKWMLTASPRARSTVQIEGMYTGFSTMTVLRVPAAEWHSFSECPASSLVGYTIVGDESSPLYESIDNELSATLWAEKDKDPSRPRPRVQRQRSLSFEAPQLQECDVPSTRAPERDSATADANGQKKQRKALPTERKLLPLGASSPLASAASRKEPASHAAAQAQAQAERPQYRPTLQDLQNYRDTVQLQQFRQAADKDLSDKQAQAQLAEAAQKPFKISIKQAEQSHMCKECSAGFNDGETLYNHVRKQHTRPFHCVFNWAGCESTFASKNEWKRHVMSQHILLHYWVCQVDQCCKIVNKSPGMAPSNNKFSLPNGAIFNRKDLYTQHLRRMHTPLHVKKLMKQVKAVVKPPNHWAISDWESRLKELQEGGIRPRCRLPDYMRCPVPTCGTDFHGNNAWDERMEHVARHLEAAAVGREPPVVFGGSADPTLTDWATRYEVGIAKRVGPNTWHLDNPLRPEIMEWTGDVHAGAGAGAGVAGSRDHNMELDDVQGRFSTAAESYGQQQQHQYQYSHQHQQQYQHQHQHQHQFRVPHLHQRQQFPPPHAMQPHPQAQYEQSPRPLQMPQQQHPYPRQYQQERQPAYAEEWRAERDRREARMEVEPADDVLQEARETRETQETRETRETRENGSRDPIRAAPSPEVSSETPLEVHADYAPPRVLSEERSDSPVYASTVATTPKSVDAEPVGFKASTSNDDDDDDDETPNEEEITVATS